MRFGLLRQGSLELFYADDTLLMCVSGNALERFLAAVSSAGENYGLELHWALGQVAASEGQVQHCSAQACIAGELARRRGIAAGECRKLSRLWRHSRLGRARKVEFFAAIVVSILLYGLGRVPGMSWCGRVSGMSWGGWGG